MAATRRDDWHNRIKAIEREFLAARLAVDLLVASLPREATKLPPEIAIQDVLQMSENLEGTYQIRLFAAFEAGLRSYWGTLRDTVPKAEDLINSLAARRGIPDPYPIRRSRSSGVPKQDHS